MPMRTRRKSLPICASIERRPLCPAVPPPIFTLTLNGARSSSSWKTVSVVESELVEAHRLADRAAAVVHEGRGLEQQDARRRRSGPAAIQPWKAFFGGSKPCTSAIASTAMKPTLCRCMRILRAGIAEADPELHGAIPPIGRLGASGWPGTSTGSRRRGCRASAGDISLRRLGFVFALGLRRPSAPRRPRLRRLRSTSAPTERRSWRW